MKPYTQKIRLPVPPFFTHHHVENNPVLPAVEAMEYLAAEAIKHLEGVNAFSITDARFSRFCFLDPGKDDLEAILAIESKKQSVLNASLSTRQSSKSGITRTMEHASITISIKSVPVNLPPLDLVASLEGICTRVTPGAIYEDLVPFGPGYQNIASHLYLSHEGALAAVGSPDTDPRELMVLGSPYPLDAAFHAACVWGQRYMGKISYPVSVGKRQIFSPTAVNGRYWARVFPKSISSEMLLFDIFIYDKDGILFEAILDVGMRDMSQGRVHPPSWIKDEKKIIFSELDQSFSVETAVVERNTLAPFAEKCLSTMEKKRFDPMSDKRKTAFLAGRLALKRLVRRGTTHGNLIPAHEINTVCRDSEKPSLPDFEHLAGCHCSLSHDGRFAIAALSEHTVGVDVEKNSQRPFNRRQMFMADREQMLVEKAMMGSFKAALNVWSAKEAVAKAMNISLADAWHRILVLEVKKGETFLKVDGEEKLRVMHCPALGHLFSIIVLSG